MIATAADQPVPLSVAMPVYNEQDAILHAVAEVQRCVLDAVPGAELVVVTDGSRDRTGALLDEVAAADARVHVIHQQNRGHGGALLAALGAARGQYLCLVDSDRQIPLDAFAQAWGAVTAGHDAVFGVRRRRHDPPLRLYLSGAVRRTVRLLFGVRIQDPNVPFKIVRREVWDAARAVIPDDTLAPSLFLAIATKRRGFNVLEIDVIHKERDTGEVSIRRLKLLKFCARGLAQLLAFRRRVY
jgi:glycosyltransferase involved in cell wall biosynthesis